MNPIQPSSSIVSFPVYTKTAYNILNAAYTFCRKTHVNSALACTTELQFDPSKMITGELMLIPYKSFECDYAKLLAKTLNEMLRTAPFSYYDENGIRKIMSISSEDRNDRKSKLQVGYIIVVDAGKYYSKTSHVTFKLTNAWLLHDFFKSRFSIEEIAKKYEPAQIDEVIGHQKNPFQIERIKAYFEEKANIENKYKELISKKVSAINSKIQCLEKERADYRREQQKLQEIELKKLQNDFEMGEMQ